MSALFIARAAFARTAFAGAAIFAAHRISAPEPASAPTADQKIALVRRHIPAAILAEFLNPNANRWPITTRTPANLIIYGRYPQHSLLRQGPIAVFGPADGTQRVLRTLHVSEEKVSLSVSVFRRAQYYAAAQHKDFPFVNGKYTGLTPLDNPIDSKIRQALNVDQFCPNEYAREWDITSSSPEELDQVEQDAESIFAKSEVVADSEA